MFPYQLAQGPFSLRSGAGPTAALSIGVVLGADGGVEEYTVAPSLVEPRARLTYRQAGLPRPSLPLPAPPPPHFPLHVKFGSALCQVAAAGWVQRHTPRRLLTLCLPNRIGSM